MRWTLMILGALVLATVAFGAWVRFAPSDSARWHTDPAAGAAGDNSHVAKAYIALPPAEALSAFDAVATAEPRTMRLAGSVEDGRVTYVSRSRLWGFPDFTTVEAAAGEGGTWLVIHARARFGQSDLGVNAARVGRWLAAIPGYDSGPRPAS